MIVGTPALVGVADQRDGRRRMRMFKRRTIECVRRPLGVFRSKQRDCNRQHGGQQNHQVPEAQVSHGLIIIP
ncbi:MAG: hypothetical protein ABS75_32555 [Pelagibacterium sp. SCN 63-23]|nr:MAG: hypothetical protein ABS75_32555 [Pelagibacterium sp. SCN 63-23]